MITVRLYGRVREECGKNQLDVEASTVREAIDETVKTGADKKLLQKCVIFLNDRPLRGLNRFESKLRDGDILAFLPPVGGG